MLLVLCDGCRALMVLMLVVVLMVVVALLLEAVQQ